MRKPEYLLKSFALILAVLTVFAAILPWEVAWVDMLFTAILVGVLAIIISKNKEQYARWAIVFASIYWFSKLIPGKVGAILSVSGVGLAFILAFCLAEKMQARSS